MTWAEYFERNPASGAEVDKRERMLRACLSKMLCPPNTVLEVGAGLGENLAALSRVWPSDMAAVEPNHTLYDVRQIPGSAQKIETDDQFVLVFTCACLIHVPPHEIVQACRELARVSSRYVLLIEYFADKHQEIVWHGQRNLLWKGDFGSDFLDANPDWRHVDHGFFWKPATGLDNLTWWLFETCAVRG